MSRRRALAFLATAGVGVLLGATLLSGLFAQQGTAPEARVRPIFVQVLDGSGKLPPLPRLAGVTHVRYVKAGPGQAAVLSASGVNAAAASCVGGTAAIEVARTPTGVSAEALSGPVLAGQSQPAFSGCSSRTLARAALKKAH